MGLGGTYYDLDTPYEIKGVVVRENGSEIAMDFDGAEERFTLSLKRVQGTLFKGQATSPVAGVAEVTCRVYEDRAEGLMVVVGSYWKYPGSPPECRWFAEIALVD